MRRLLLAIGLCVSTSAWAAAPIEDVRNAELDRARAEIADQVQLAAYDLIDEMVYGIREEPVFEGATPIVLAGVTVPVGLGAGLAALVENHLGSVLGQNPTTNLQLVHCPTCTSVVVQSGPEATIVSRGIDNPATLADLGTGGGKHALFVDLEAEGAFLVLRARITKLTPDLPIVWSHTLTTSASTPALMREGARLKSATEAREDYLNVLKGRSKITIPVRVGLRTYAAPTFNDGATGPPPFIWFQSGVEFAATDAKAWTSSLLIGYSFVPMAYQGMMVQSRVSRLITGRARSLTRPDVYLFAGVAAISAWGPAAGGFTNDTLTTDQIIAGINQEGPRNLFGAVHMGLEGRIGKRIGASVFLESMPTFQNSNNMGSYARILGLNLQSFGTEVTFCF